MTATTLPPPRIQTLDIVRGVAVMGILAMNIIAFSMPFQAYMNPAAYGLESNADLASWAFSFVFIDGKMRGLFSFLFGASTLLVIERAQAAGRSPARIHYARMIWLLVFGLVHYYFIWFGDILTLYALMGLLLFFYRNSSVKKLIVWGCILVAVQFLLFGGLAAAAAQLSQMAASGNADPEMARQWEEMNRNLGVLSGAPLAQKLALFHGSYEGLVHHRLIQNTANPLTSALMFGWETLGYMLFGMAALRSGFLRGEWPLQRYRKWAVIGFGIGIPVYAILAWLMLRADFGVPAVLALNMAATVPFRPAMIIATAALVILLTRNGGALIERIAAAGRAAFTNYLGTSILMTCLFYGYGFDLYGSLSRVELWLVVFVAWALMLLWSKPWLDRFAYGPLEWLWRSLARGSIEPLRRPVAATTA